MAKILNFVFLFVFVCCTIDCNAGPDDDLLNACKSGKLDAVKKAIAEGAKVNGVDPSTTTPLSLAFFWPDIVKYLLENKADPNLGNPNILYQATFYSSYDVLKLILDAGADPNKPYTTDPATTFKSLIATEKSKGKEANKAMIKAWESAMETLKPTEVYALPTLVTHSNCVPCLKLLLEKGASLEKGTTDGTLIHTFANSGASKEYRNTVFAAIKTSVEKYGFVFPDWYTNMPNDRNGNPDEILKLLLGKGLDINQKNKSATKMPDQTPLEMALGEGFGNKEEVTLALVNNGADIKTDSKWYGPLILQAAQCGFPTVLKAMIEKGADINTEGKCFTDADNGAQISNFTPLTCAAAKNHLPAVKVLVEKGASMQGISGSIVSGVCPAKLNNKSAIYFAIEHKNMDMVKYLVEHHAYDGKKLSISAKKMTGCIGGGSYSPSEYAEELDANDLMEYLKKHNM